MEIMNTRVIQKDNLNIENLTGISKRCDWLINGETLLNITNTDRPGTIFIVAYKGGLGVKYLANHLLPNINSPFILIVASTDYTFPSGSGDVRLKEYANSQESIQIILESTKIKHIFVENLDTSHPKMSPIPLGVLPWRYTLTPFNIEEYIYVDFSIKQTLCLCNHRTSPWESKQWDDRIKVNNLCKKEWSSFTKLYEKEISEEKFISEIRQTKFSLCIHGGGLDPCPRFFYAILYGAIPILKHSTLDPVFSKFPVVFINDLTANSLSEDFLLTKYEELKEFYIGEKREQVLSMLTVDFWWDLIIKGEKI
jgi:hypothetical protein